MFSKKTYNIVSAPAKAWDWHRYERTLAEKWSHLLKNQQNYCERDFEQFFELHPCMLPWLYGEIGRGAHGMFPNALISQPILPGLDSKIPDFMWIASDSSSVFVVLIEIEDPNKSWATKKGQPSEKLTQAINQLKEWQQWFSEPLNEEIFKKDYRIPPDLLEFRSFQKIYILIYGRRSDPSLTDSFNKKRALLENQNEIFMTYDRIIPSRQLKDCLTVKLDRSGYTALHVQPTMQLGPIHAEYRSLIQQKDLAVDRNIYLSQTRKQFINSRWEYWDTWAKKENKGLIALTDEE